ncbi:ATP-binding protein [Luteimonas kalidii]|uniref:histidine kinase n=1 Tax=Luteimonas kalidii TaxID=3042025 RepID=A0ABT6JQ78_9GAMM|nr:ATP-binding protein [Luteimonas kalidii]MDH5832633.1 histidine kinase [Luteimonas kalidii]
MPDPATASTPRPARALLGEFTRLLLLAVVLPVLVLSGVLLWQASVSVREQSATRLAATANAGARELEGFLQVHQAALQVLADRRATEGNLDDVQRWQADLARISRHYPAFATMLVTDAQGRVLASTPPLSASGPRSVADREYFRVPARTGRSHVSNAFRGRGHGRDVLVAVSVPIQVDGRFAGVLEGSILVDSLGMRRGGLEEHGFEVLLLDRALTVVQASAGVPQRPLYALGDARGDRDLARVSNGGGMGSLRAALRDGEDAFAFAARLDNGWRLVLLQPHGAVDAELRRNALALLAVLALLLTGLLAVVVAKLRRLGDSVHRLLERMQQFALDSDPAPIAPDDLPSELLPLADTMNALAARARASYDAVNLSLQEQSHLREELQSVAQRLLTVQEDERRALSRELHDDIGQSITAIKLAATSLTDDSLATDAAVRREILDEVIEIADQTVLKLRNLSLLLRPPQLDSLGLEAALRGQVAVLARNSRLDIGLDVAPVGRRLPAEVELACFRIAQEALTNVARHAGATRAEVSVAVQDSGGGRSLVLRVTDDGRGIDPERPGGLGLLTMRERATQLGGSLSISARRAGGTQVCAVLPIPGDNA